MRSLLKLRREILVGLSKLGLKEATIYRAGKKYKIPLFHGMGRFLFVTYEPWRKKTLTAVSKMNPKVILDVGVNVGQTLLDIQELLPKVTYYGFEPHSACVFYVNELIRLNKFANVSVLPFGLGLKSEITQLHSSGWDDASSSMLARSSAEYSTTVCTKNGDDFISDEGISDISFLKIDTEGYEFLVLKGLKNTIEVNQPIIFCEIFSGKEENKELYKFVIDLNYIIYEQTEGFELQMMNSDNIFKNPCHDYIFAPRKKSKEFENHFIQ